MEFNLIAQTYSCICIVDIRKVSQHYVKDFLVKSMLKGDK